MANLARSSSVFLLSSFSLRARISVALSLMLLDSKSADLIISSIFSEFLCTYISKLLSFSSMAAWPVMSVSNLVPKLVSVLLTKSSKVPSDAGVSITDWLRVERRVASLSLPCCWDMAATGTVCGVARLAGTADRVVPAVSPECTVPGYCYL